MSQRLVFGELGATITVIAINASYSITSPSLNYFIVEVVGTGNTPSDSAYLSNFAAQNTIPPLDSASVTNP